MTRRFGLLIMLALVSSVAIPRPGTAQSTAIIPGGKMSEDDRGRVTAQAFADCLMKRKRLWVERLLAAPNPTSNKMIARGDMSECLDHGSLRFQPNLLRGALFGAKYRLAFGVNDVAPALTPGVTIFYAADAQADPGFYFTLRSADCVVTTNAAPVRRLILSRPGTPDETAAFRDVAPLLRDCVTPGATVRFSKAVLDGFLAEALYRRTVAASGAEGAR